MISKLITILKNNEEKIIAHRRYLHQHPELSYLETNTSSYIEKIYQNKACLVQKVSGNSLIVTIKGKSGGKTLAIRGDFDALPIEERTNLSFSSLNPGVMHACGHDGHTAYLLGLADVLIQTKELWQGTIKIIHQAAEEVPPGGALEVVRSGLLDDVDCILGLHLWSPLSFGTIGCTSGSIMAGRSKFEVNFKGRGGHGSSPQLSKDTNLAVAFFQTAVQTIVSRRIDPFELATLTIGSVEGGGIFNVIKEEVSLSGDVRYVSNDVKDTIESEFRKILEGIKIMFDVDYELNYTHDYPTLKNDEHLTSEILNILQKSKNQGVKEINTAYKVSASEDFAYYKDMAPICYLFVGAAPDVGLSYPHHHPKFDINEKSLLLAAELMAEIVIKLLDK